MKLRGVVDALKDIHPAFVDKDNRTNFIDFIREARQADAHSMSNETRHLFENPQLVCYVTMFMSYFLRVMMFYKCGATADALQSALSAMFSQYKFYDAEVAKSLKTWTKCKKKRN